LQWATYGATAATWLGTLRIRLHSEWEEEQRKAAEAVKEATN
jgi:hypothetical protein